MNVSTKYHLVALLLVTTLCNHVNGQQACVVGGFSLRIDGECSYNNVLEEFDITQFSMVPSCPHTAPEDLNLLLGLDLNASAEDAKAAVRAVCKGSWNDFKFADIARKYEQFEQIYYNGGTHWNEEVQTNIGVRAHSLDFTTHFAKEFFESSAPHVKVEWPDYLTNFDPETCEINAAYCCWPQDRQAGDNNGNCNNPYDENCYDKDPADNTDLCYVDLTRSPQSNNFGGTSGSMLFPHDDHLTGEGPIHCHGFAWSNDEHDFTNRYKGNNLFYVTMYDHLTQRGYVRNVPGAPMCACAEQMPTVTRSDCTQMDVTEVYYFNYNEASESFTAELIALNIDFNSCQGKFGVNNDLWYYFLRLQDEGKVTANQKHALNKYLVGDNNCDMAQEYQMSQMNLTRGYDHDTSSWTRIAGRGNLYETPLGRDGFKKYFETTNKIIRRVCAHCGGLHQDIYYKRLTPVPDDMDLLEYMMNTWKEKDNQFNVDFKLYSSLEDAENDDNAWTFCNFHNFEGFPFECGPNGRVLDQWSTFRTFGGRRHVAFYLQTSIPLSQVAGVDIGNVRLRGVAYEMDSEIYVTGSGKDVSDEFDQFYYALPTPMASDDITMQVHITKHNAVNDEGKAGIMIRQNLESTSENVYCFLDGLNNVSFQYRSSIGGDTTMVNGIDDDDDTTHASIWLRLEKRGNNFICQKSIDGGDRWVDVSDVVTLNNWNSYNFSSGLAVGSHNYGRSSEAVFENYEVVSA